MRIAVLGTGMVGRRLAAGFAGAGHDVVIGTRDPDVTLARTTPDAMGNPPFAVWWEGHVDIGLAPFDAVADSADVVVNATSGAATLDALALVGHDLDGRVLLDVANPLDLSGPTPTLFTTMSDSLAERIQRAHPNARVVKGLNMMTAELMVDPGMLHGEHLVFVAGDDDGAKQVVRDLLTGLGWPAAHVHDLGGLTAARGMEASLLLWLDLMNSLGTPYFNLALVRRRPD